MNGNFRSALTLSIAIVLSTLIGSWSYLHAKRLDLTVKVTGSAKKRIKSDLMVWRTSVIAEAPSLSEAYGKLSHDVARVKAFLVAHGVPENQIIVSAVATIPVRRARTQNPNSQTNGGEESAGGPVTGYHLKQSLGIRSSEVDKITAISRQVTELINQGILLESEEPEYLYTRLADTKVEILAQAAQDARARALQIAASAGSNVGELRSADMGVIQITAADSNNVSDYGENDTKSLEKDITAVVHMTFAVN
jgi:hypothetical protein